MTVAAKSIAVFGGNGFLGKRICEAAIRSGYTVYGLLRSGSKPKEINHNDAYWISKVKWQKADMFDPQSYKKTLSEVDTVVHSVGMLFENQEYKKSLNGSGFFSTIRSVAEAVKGGNPMEKNYENTYEAVQRDSAIALADALIKAKQSKKRKAQSDSNDLEGQKRYPTFVYILADQQLPMVPSKYLSTKREAEFMIASKPGIRSIFARPGFMYDEALGWTNRTIFGSLLSTGYDIKEYIFRDNIGPLNELVRPPISTQKVATEIMKRIDDDKYSGVLSLDEMMQ